MSKFRCTKDFYYEDVLIAAKGDIVEISNNSLVNASRDTTCTKWGNIRDHITTNSLVEVKETKADMVNHPSHYTWLKGKCGIEVIDITRWLDFDTGNAVKYLLRAGHKSEEGITDREKTIQDLKKAVWYINDKIKQLEDGNQH